MMKQLCDRQMQVLGSPLKTLMCFFIKEEHAMLLTQFVSPHIVMVLISSLCIFVFVISSFAVALNFKMWTLKNLL
jgi:hypothetical protein